MSNPVVIKRKLQSFNKKIFVSGDKSISIRWILFASLANGNSKAQNLLISEDVIAAIKTIRKLGIKVTLKNNLCKIYVERDGSPCENNFSRKRCTVYILCSAEGTHIT